MIVTPRIVVRIALLLLLGVILQLSFFSRISVLGTSPNILPVLVVCLGLLGGAVLGAVCGFAVGFLIDSALLQTLGVSSLVLLTAGYLAGRYREGFDISSPLICPALAGALTLLAASGFAAVQLMLGVEAPISLLVLRELVVQAILGFLLAIPIYPIVRRVLRAALVEDTPRRGRLPIPFRTA
ncbi:MAG TPA: rod shape-determining protein MreD [Solirubrobacterales bacterium]|nr:rod shape-determining protein MreD [Solirubrobacterales bacterium]